MKTYSLHDKFQSAYRSAHSTETAMLHITNDLLLAAADKCLVLLVLSAAFDTIDHRILLQKLSSRLHLSKSAVHWFASYLEDRYQKVVIGDETSSNFKLQYGVPQGSVLGPLLFTLHTADLGEIIKKHGLTPLLIGGVDIFPVENVKSLGVTLDSCLTLTNMSVPVAVLLLCTSETLERFVIF